MTEKEDVLSPFLIKANRCYLDNDIAAAQKEIMRSICSDLTAVCCTVYLKKDHSYQPYLEHTLAETTSFSLQLGNLELHDTPVYINKIDDINRLFPDSPVERCLYLPLLQEKKLYGFLLALWDRPSLFDQCSVTAMGFLLPLSLILEKIFAESSLIQSLHEQEAQLEDLYLTIQQEFNEHLRTMSLTLHDEIDRMLLAVILQLEAVQGLDDMEIIKGRLAGLQYIAEQSLEKVQQVYTQINPHLLSRVGLKTALIALVQEYGALRDIEVGLNIIGEALELPVAVETMIYQVTRQVLSYLKQQQYQGKAAVQLTAKQGRTFLQVTGQDRWVMQDIAERKLKGLHRQVSVASGKLWLNSQDAQGASINLLLLW